MRTPASGIRASRPPRAAAGDRLAGDGRDVELRFGSGERRAAFTIENNGIPAGTYELPLRLSTPGGLTVKAGSARVRVFAAVREAGEGEAWRRFPRAALNASNDTVEQSEAFVAVTPVDERRYALGINGADAMTAFVTQDGGQTFVRDVMPATTDAPGETGPESSVICCDPMFAAGDGGDLWFGGLSFENGAANPSRIVVNRIAAGETSFRDVTVGLPLSAGTNGTQDKPLMTVDNAPRARPTAACTWSGTSRSRPGCGWRSRAATRGRPARSTPRAATAPTTGPRRPP